MNIHHWASVFRNRGRCLVPSSCKLWKGEGGREESLGKTTKSREVKEEEGISASVKQSGRPKEHKSAQSAGSQTIYNFEMCAQKHLWQKGSHTYSCLSNQPIGAVECNKPAILIFDVVFPNPNFVGSMSVLWYLICSGYRHHFQQRLMCRSSSVTVVFGTT
jgi:hypothetical protein